MLKLHITHFLSCLFCVFQYYVYVGGREIVHTKAGDTVLLEEATVEQVRSWAQRASPTPGGNCSAYFLCPSVFAFTSRLPWPVFCFRFHVNVGSDVTALVQF